MFLATERKDRWWLEPLLTLTILLTFIVYANWAAYQGEHYWFGPYLSPFYSPELLG
ncbi:MAG: succinate dehydrogenase, partial [Deltaproteobacteria bacterium]|nr:succinate dehydrogenase [Nannocystaceae bacterium]